MHYVLEEVDGGGVGGWLGGGGDVGWQQQQKRIQLKVK